MKHLRAYACGLLGLCATTDWVCAQSDVSIYGIVDVGVTKANNGNSPAISLPGRAAQDTWVVKNGNSSRLGFRGREDLGDGNYARFNIETRFNPDTGTQSSTTTFWFARSFVAIGSPRYGEVYAGRLESPVYANLALLTDPTYWTYVSQTGMTYNYANYAGAPAVESLATRWSNTVGYKSPKLGGFTAELAVSAGEGVRKRNTAGTVKYEQGPIWIGVGMDRLDSDNNLVVVDGGYDFGVVKPTFGYARAKGGANGDAKSYSLGANIPTAWGRAYLTAGRYAPSNQLDSRMVGLGAEYSLSKRTRLYSNAGTARRDGATRTTAFDVGIFHTF